MQIMKIKMFLSIKTNYNEIFGAPRYISKDRSLQKMEKRLTMCTQNYVKRYAPGHEEGS